MITRRTWGLALLAITNFGLQGCNIDTAKMQAQIDEQLQTRENSADENLSGIELTDDDSKADEVAKYSEEEQARLAKIEGLLKRMGEIVNACSGMDESVKAFQSRVEELKAAGKSPEEIRAELEPVQQELRAKMVENREKFRTCRDEAKDSELGVSVKSVVDACFSKPDRPIEGPKHKGHGPDGGGRGGKNGHGDRGGRLGGKHKGQEPPQHNGVRLPPLDFQKLSDPVCVESVDKI